MVLAVNPEDGYKGHGDIPSADICQHLARHGVNAEAQSITGYDVEVGDFILSRAADQGADLIVMGAYGHSRLRELVLGGATAHILGYMTVPVLMSHRGGRTTRRGRAGRDRRLRVGQPRSDVQRAGAPQTGRNGALPGL